jgi:kinetochore protein Spc7/SPC105
MPKTNPDLDKENVTADIGAVRGAYGAGKPTSKDKKSRSKSLGPGGLDALQYSNGNRRKVILINVIQPWLSVWRVAD